MSAIELLSGQVWVERLGWTLLHFVWQGLAIALVYGVVRAAMRKRATAELRYWLACGALAAMMAAPVATWAWLGAGGPAPEVSYHIASAPPVPSSAPLAGEPAAAMPGEIAPPDRWTAWVVIVWLAGAGLFWVRLAGGWVLTVRMRSSAVRPAPIEWQETLRRLASRIGLSRPVKLLVSAMVESPSVVGWLRPVILAPVGALNGMPTEHVEALLLHELAHIRRHDFLVGLLQGVAETLLFYHPAVWWVSGHVRTDRELCCDDLAVATSGNAFAYAGALAQLEAARPAMGAAMSATGGSLSRRIARVLGSTPPEAPREWLPDAAAAVIVVIVAGCRLFAQPDVPAFEVASIKANPAKWANPQEHPMGVGYRPGGRMAATNASLRMLIQFAYADHDLPHWMPLPSSRVVGGPAWVGEPGYDIEAKPAQNTDTPRAWLMMQRLLADRFRLELHRETRELSVYELRPSRRGLKLSPAKDASCVSFPPGAPPRPTPGKVDCGYVPVLRESDGLRMTGRKLHMVDLVRELSAVLDRPVIDRTGFTGEFDLDLRFRGDDSLAGLPAGFGGSEGAILFDALEEQLGLRLAAAKGPVDVLVVDHADRPSEN